MATQSRTDILASAASASLFCVLCVQRYGLWDHEDPLEEQSSSPELYQDEGRSSEVDEAGKRKKGGGEYEEEENRIRSTSTLEKLESIGRNQFEKVGIGYCPIQTHC